MLVYPHKYLVYLDMASSNSEGKRLIEQGGVKVNGERLEWEVVKGGIEVKHGDTFLVGKRHYIRLEFEDEPKD